jgi:predicted thioredoxin/glutaredoxin
MKVELLGLPNAETAALEATLREALERLGLTEAVELTRVEDMTAVIARGVRRPPALRVDGRVVCRGRVPGLEEIVTYLEGTQA